MEDVNLFSKPSAIGIAPRYIRDSERLQEILAAMGRFVQSNQRIPDEWLSELNELLERHNSRKTGPKNE